MSQAPIPQNGPLGPSDLPAIDIIRRHVQGALAEDLGPHGDLTARFFLQPGILAVASFTARAEGVIAGLPILPVVFAEMEATDVEINNVKNDGALVAPGEILATVKGDARSLVTAERTALNYLQRLSGIATLTRRFVDAVAGFPATILDTRKTTPGWRTLEKYAVRCGGGANHRMGLYDAAMVKDNHLAASSDPQHLQRAAAALRKAHPEAWIEVEADTLDQVRRFLDMGCFDRILLDNMSVSQMNEAVALVDGAVPLEASGGISLERVREIAATGVDFISVGALTHSAVALDIGLDFRN